MATNTFDGSADTALNTYDSNWEPNTSVDGLTGLELDGSGNLRNDSAFNFSDAFYQDGVTNEDSRSRITIPAGVAINASVGLLGVTCRMTTTQHGYAAITRSSTSVNTNFDSIALQRNGSFLATITLNAPINANTTPIDLAVEFSDADGEVWVTVNGTRYDTVDGTPLTGGFPGIIFRRNGAGSSSFLIADWTDDVVAEAGGSVVPMLPQRNRRHSGRFM
jgi:hypothetical protein